MKMRWNKHLLVWLCTLIVCFIILWPTWWIVKSSFTDVEHLFDMPVDYTLNHATLDNYKTLFNSTNKVDRYITNTLLVSAITLVLSTLLCSLAGYAFCRTKTRGISLAFKYVLFSTMVPSTVTIIPLLQMWNSTGLRDTVPGLTILYVSMVIPFSVTVFSSYIYQVPRALEEAAWIDGTGILGGFFRIIFPLLKPMIATLCIINFISCINEFFYPLLFTTRNVKMLSQIVYNVVRNNQYTEPWDLYSAAGCLMLAPTILFIVLFEKNILNGLMMGSIKQ